MWSGDIPKGSWGLDMDICGDRDTLEKIMKTVTNMEGVTVKSVQFIMGSMEEEDEQKAGLYKLTQVD